MPIVPIMNGPQKEAVGTQLPNVEIRHAGLVASALAGLGGEAAQIGVDLYKKRTKEDLIQAVTQSSYDYGRELNQQDIALKQKYNGTDFKGYAQEYDQMLSTTKQKYLDNLDSDAKKNYFSSSANSMIAEKLIHADNFENEARRNYYVGKTDERIANLGGDGDYIKANRDLKDEDLLINNSEIYDNKTRAALQEKMSNAAYETVKSIIIMKNNKAALALLDGKDPKNSDEILKRLTPFQQTQLRVAAVQSEMQMKNEFFNSALNNMREAEIGVTSGQMKYNDPVIQAVEKQIELFPAEQQRELKRRFAGMKAVAQMQDTFALLPLWQRDVQSIANAQAEHFKVKDPLEAVALKGAVSEKLNALNSNLQAEFNKDPVGYLARRDQSLSDLSVAVIQGDQKVYQQYKAKLDGFYDQWGIEKQSRNYMSPALNKKYGEGIKNAIEQKDENITLDLFSELEDMTGKDSFAAIKELGLPENYAVVGEIKDKVLRKHAIQNIMNPVSDDLYKEKIGDPKSKYSTLMEDDLFSMYLAVGNDQKSKSNAMIVLDTVNEHYKRLRLDKMSDENAQKEAWRMFSSTFQPISSPKASVMVPTTIANTENIKNFMEDYVGTKTNKFTQATHQWVSSANRDGMMLLQPSHDNPSYLEPLKDAKGEPVIFKFDDINKVKYPPGKSWLDDEVDKRRKEIIRNESQSIFAPGNSF